MTVRYGKSLSPDTFTIPSASVWGNCPVEGLKDGRVSGVYVYEDFVKVPVLVTPTITTEANYGSGFSAFGSSGGTVIGAQMENGGGLIMTETDDNEGIAVQQIQCPFKIDFGKGDFWFEVCFKTNEVADTKHGILTGLIEAASLSATVPITAAGAIADQNMVGFHRLEGDGDQIDTVYKANGVTAVSVKTDAISTTAGVHTAAGSLAASVFIKLGMKYKRKKSRLYFYINGVELPDYKSIPSSMGDGDDFPNDVQMGLFFAFLCASNDDAINTLAWIAGAQIDVSSRGA